MNGEQLHLFDVETPPVRHVPAKPEPTRPRWTKYRTVKTEKCDDCLAVLIMAKGNGPATRPAVWRRKSPGTDLLLCYGHAQARKADDERLAAS